VHVDYGTGTPAEAAAWVRHANLVRHDHVRDWTIGEETYLNGGIPGLTVEPDAHQDKSAAAYGRGVVAYAKAMKAVDPSVRIGIELAPPIAGSPFLDWDKTVLAIAGHSADFVDLHWYPYTAKSFFDTVRQVPAIMSATRTLVDQVAGPRVRIVVGETNSAVAASEQETSVTNAVFLADDELSLLENGASAVDWWALHNGTASLPDDVDLALLSSGNTGKSGPGPQPTDVPFATYYGQELTGALATPGSTLLGVTGADGPVFAHAARQRNGSLVVLLLNEDATAAHWVNLAVAGYRAQPGAQRLFLGGAGTGIARSAGSATGVQDLPANSLTELVLRPVR
jgi:alpha-L-arabinofuranosidase